MTVEFGGKEVRQVETRSSGSCDRSTGFACRLCTASRKGCVLEAALAGVPALLPNRAFPERVADLQFGQLYEPGSRKSLADAILNLPSVDSGLIPSHSVLHDRCLERYGMATTGPEVLKAIREVIR
ncbi:MAG: hypothetical protein WKF77_00085 [Planctomycetaceae bacterium]